MSRTTSKGSGLVSILVKGGLIVGAAWLATRYFGGDRAGEVGSRWDWPRSGGAGQWDWPTASDSEDSGQAARTGANPSV